MDKELFLDFTYGNYIVSAVNPDGPSPGAAMNTVFQLTEEPWLVGVCFNHISATGRQLQKSGRAAITVMGQSVPLEVEDLFGTRTSDEVDKFAHLPHATAPNGAPYLTSHARSWFSGTVRQVMELPSHNFFILEITHAGRLDDTDPPMTYADFRRRKAALENP